MTGPVPPNLALVGVLLVLLAAFIEGLAQVCLKVGARSLSRPRSWMALGVALFVIEILLYTGGLRSLDVSVAYPLSALNYAVVVAASALFLKERGGLKRWCGVALVVLGAALSAPGL